MEGEPTRSSSSRADSPEAYLLVPLWPGELGELGVVVDGEDEVSGGVLGLLAGGGVVDGEADGVVRSPGRSPTRSERDSVQPATNVTPSASAQNPESSFFIAKPPLSARYAGLVQVQSKCHGAATLDTLRPLSGGERKR